MMLQRRLYTVCLLTWSVVTVFSNEGHRLAYYVFFLVGRRDWQQQRRFEEPPSRRAFGNLFFCSQQRSGSP